MNKNLDIKGLDITIQYNPIREISTTAAVDDKSVNSRACFLCAENIPPAQKGISYSDYLLLINPYPIFPVHLTIAHKHHIPQRITGAIKSLLMFSKELSPQFFLMYNGPECGASAPDHMHFQAGSRHSLPLLQKMHRLAEKEDIIVSDSGIRLTAADDGLRKMMVLTGNDTDNINAVFQKTLSTFQKYSSGVKEPSLNVVSFYDNTEWKIIIFLREKHRPDIYFEEGGKGVKVSPAAADLGGLIITPYKKDFDMLNEDLVSEILLEVNLNENTFRDFIKKLKSSIQD